MPVNSCLLWSPITQKPEVFFSPVPKSRRFLARSCQIHLQTQTVKTLGHHTTPKPCAICDLYFRQNNSRFFSHLSAALSSILYRRSFAKNMLSKSTDCDLFLREARFAPPWKVYSHVCNFNLDRRLRLSDFRHTHHTQTFVP
jgi:hypothetical protein